MITLVFSLLGLGRTLTHRTLLAGRFDWGVKTNHCWTLSITFENKKFEYHTAMFCLITSNELSCWQCARKVKVMGSNPGYLLEFFLLYQTWKKEIYDFWKFTETKKENDDGLNGKKSCLIVLTIFSLTKKIFIQNLSKWYKQ